MHPRSTKRATIADGWRDPTTRIFRWRHGFCRENCASTSSNIYAYCRISDDLADEIGDAEVSLQLLDQWEGELDASYAGRARHPVFVALAETVQKFEIPKQEFADLLTAFRQDQRVKRYETFQDLLGTADIRRIRWATWCCICAGTAMASGRCSRTTPARDCSWRTSGRM